MTTPDRAPLLSFVKGLFKPKEPSYPPLEASARQAMEPELIAPFFTRLVNDARFRLPTELGELVAEGLAELAPGETRKWKIDAAFEGRPLKIDLELDLSDAELPELSFLTSKAAAAAIDEELATYVDAEG